MSSSPSSAEPWLSDALERARLLATQASILTHIAIENSVPAAKNDSSRPMVNRPATSAFRLSAKPLISRYRHNVGSPFFTDYWGDTPPKNADAAAIGTVLSEMPPPGEHKGRFNAGDDANLVEGVYRCAKADLLEQAFRRHDMPVPDVLKPLSNVSLPTLTNLGPRAHCQYVDTFDPACISQVGLQRLTPERQSLFQEDLGAVLKLSRAAVLAAAAVPATLSRGSSAGGGAGAGAAMADDDENEDDDDGGSGGPSQRRPVYCADVDWVRVAHGGFMRQKLMATPADCKVRWFSHARPGLKHGGRWTADDDEALAEAVEAVGGQGNWELVSQQLNNGRSAFECFQRWVAKHEPPPAVKAPWTPEEDAALLESVGSIGSSDWTTVAAQFEARTPAMCSKRYEALRSSGASASSEDGPSAAAAGASSSQRKLGAFSLEEDARLLILQRMYCGEASTSFSGAHNDEMHSYFPQRAPKAMSERFAMLLKQAAATAARPASASSAASAASSSAVGAEPAASSAGGWGRGRRRPRRSGHGATANGTGTSTRGRSKPRKSAADAASSESSEESGDGEDDDDDDVTEEDGGEQEDDEGSGIAATAAYEAAGPRARARAREAPAASALPSSSSSLASAAGSAAVSASTASRLMQMFQEDLDEEDEDEGSNEAAASARPPPPAPFSQGAAAAAAAAPVKRGRGRPGKHPVALSSASVSAAADTGAGATDGAASAAAASSSTAGTGAGGPEEELHLQPESGLDLRSLVEGTSSRGRARKANTKYA